MPMFVSTRLLQYAEALRLWGTAVTVLSATTVISMSVLIMLTQGPVGRENVIYLMLTVLGRYANTPPSRPMQVLQRRHPMLTIVTYPAMRMTWPIRMATILTRTTSTTNSLSVTTTPNTKSLHNRPTSYNCLENHNIPSQGCCPVDQVSSFSMGPPRARLRSPPARLPLGPDDFLFLNYCMLHSRSSTCLLHFQLSLICPDSTGGVRYLFTP